MNKMKEEYEEWRKTRREKWSQYKGEYTNDNKQCIAQIQKITGLSDDIVSFDENIPLQLWIDNVVDKLVAKYKSIQDSIPINTKYSTILHMIGFSLGFVTENGSNLDHELMSHHSLDEVIEIILDNLIYDNVIYDIL